VLFAAAAGGCAREDEPSTTVLRVANWTGPDVEPGLVRLERQFRQEFEAAHPGVRLQMEQIPGYGQYTPKLLMMHVAGCMPDVIHLDASAAAVFIDNGVLRDLTPLIESDPQFDLTQYFEPVVEVARRGSSLYAIPLDFTPMMMFYNKRLFDEAHVAYPQAGWTWDEFLQKAKALTVRPAGAARPTQYGFYFENWMPLWVLWLWTNGADVLDPDGRRASGYFDGPQSVEAVEFIVELMTKHRVAPDLRDSAIAGTDLFRSGRAAMDLKGHWMLLDYRADGLDVGVVPLPVRGREEAAERERATVVYAAGLAVTAASRQSQLAWEYVKFMTSRDVQVRRVASGLAISGNKLAAAQFAGTPIEDAFLAEVAYARPPWGARVERYPFLEELGREMMEDLLHARGTLSVAEALRRTVRLMDAALAEP